VSFTPDGSEDCLVTRYTAYLFTQELLLYATVNMECGHKVRIQGSICDSFKYIVIL
jgi:hypothetical protein